MGMQVAISQMAGNIALPAQREQKQPLPMERKEVAAYAAAQASAPANQKPNSPELSQTVLDLEKISLAFNRRLQFIIDQESKELIVKVIDNETDKVIKVLPPEELQRLHSRVRETMGFLFDMAV